MSRRSVVRDRVLEVVDGVKTAPEVAAEVHSEVHHVWRVLRELKAGGHIHVVSWKPGTRRMLAIYQRGAGEDAEKPFKSSTDRFRAMLERMTADDRDRFWVRTNTRRRKIKVDPLSKAFFGG